MNKPRKLLSEITKLENDLKKERKKNEILIQFVTNTANLDPMTLVKPSSVAQKTLDEVNAIERSDEA